MTLNGKEFLTKCIVKLPDGTVIDEVICKLDEFDNYIKFTSEGFVVIRFPLSSRIVNVPKESCAFITFAVESDKKKEDTK